MFCKTCAIDFSVTPIGDKVWRVQRDDPPKMAVEMQAITQDYVIALAKTKVNYPPRMITVDIFEAFSVIGELPFCVNCGGELSQLINWNYN